MKHIKTFEKKGDIFWCYISVSTTTPEVEEIYIFNDKESAENFYITKINYIAMLEKKSDENLIFTLSDAEDFLNDNDDFKVEIIQVENFGKFNLSKELKIGGDAKKYNL